MLFLVLVSFFFVCVCGFLTKLKIIYSEPVNFVPVTFLCIRACPYRITEYFTLEKIHNFRAQIVVCALKLVLIRKFRGEKPVSHSLPFETEFVRLKNRSNRACAFLTDLKFYRQKKLPNLPPISSEYCKKSIKLHRMR